MQDTQSTASGTEAPTEVQDFQRIAADLAAKHNGNGHAPGLAARNRGGRRTREEEAAEYLRTHGLRAVPVNPEVNSEGAEVNLEGGDCPPGERQERQYVVTPDFVQGCCETLLKGIEAFRQRQVFLKVQKLTPDAGLARSIAAEAVAPPGAIEVMSRCAAELTQKYDWLASCSPEALLAVAALTWAGKDLALMKRLGELEEQKAKAAATLAEPKK